MSATVTYIISQDGLLVTLFGWHSPLETPLCVVQYEVTTSKELYSWCTAFDVDASPSISGLTNSVIQFGEEIYFPQSPYTGCTNGPTSGIASFSLRDGTIQVFLGEACMDAGTLWKVSSDEFAMGDSQGQTYATFNVLSKQFFSTPPVIPGFGAVFYAQEVDK